MSCSSSVVELDVCVVIVYAEGVAGVGDVAIVIVADGVADVVVESDVDGDVDVDVDGGVEGDVDGGVEGGCCLDC